MKSRRKDDMERETACVDPKVSGSGSDIKAAASLHPQTYHATKKKFRYGVKNAILE